MLQTSHNNVEFVINIVIKLLRQNVVLQLALNFSPFSNLFVHQKFKLVQLFVVVANNTRK